MKIYRLNLCRKCPGEAAVETTCTKGQHPIWSEDRGESILLASVRRVMVRYAWR